MQEKFKEIDFDARRNPKTAHWCIKCQKDLSITQKGLRMVHVVYPSPIHGIHAVHPDFEPMVMDDESLNVGWHLIGPDCARIFGIEWTHAVDLSKL